MLNIFVSSLNAAGGRKIFSSSRISFKVKLSIKKQNLRENFCHPFCFCLLKRVFDFPVQYAFWWSNTALDGPLINQSNRVVSSSYTIMPQTVVDYYNVNAAINDTAAGGLTIFWEHTTVIPCAPKNLRR